MRVVAKKRSKMIKNFRDLLALLLAVVVFPGIWIADSLALVSVPEMILGATVSIESMIALFYFRKKPANEV